MTASVQTFIYDGTDRYGNKVYGQRVPAPDRASALRAIERAGCQAERCEVAADREGFSLRSVMDELRFVYSLDKSRLLFWRQFAQAVAAERRMEEALEEALDGAIDPMFRSVVSTVLFEVNSCNVPLEEAMARHPDVFTAAEVHLVMLGREQVPILDAIERILLTVERRWQWKLKMMMLKAPARFTLVVALIISVVAGRGVPSVYGPIYAAQRPPLDFPLPLKLLVWFASGVLSWWTLFIIICFGIPLFFWWRRASREPVFKRLRNRFEFGDFPLSGVVNPLGTLNVQAEREHMYALFAMVLSTPKATFENACRIVGRSLGSQLFGEALIEIADRIAGTKDATEDIVVEYPDVFDKFTISSLRTALKFGGLAQMFAKRAKDLEREREVEFERVTPRVQFAAQIPVIVVVAILGMAVFFPQIKLLSAPHHFGG